MNQHAPGDKVYLNGKPVTVLAEAGERAYCIPGHHDYGLCATEDLVVAKRCRYMFATLPCAVYANACGYCTFHCSCGRSAR